MTDRTSRVAIVTGASRGIGRSTAIRLGKDFTVIVLVSRSEDDLKQTANALEYLLNRFNAESSSNLFLLERERKSKQNRQ